MFGRHAPPQPPPATPSQARMIAIWASSAVNEPARKALQDTFATYRANPTPESDALWRDAAIRADAYLANMIDAVQASVDADDDTKTLDEIALVETCIEMYGLANDSRFAGPSW